MIPFSDQTFQAAPANGWARGATGEGYVAGLGGDNSKSKPLGQFRTPEPGSGECANAGLDREIDEPFAMVPANATDGTRTIIVHLDKATPPAALTVARGEADCAPNPNTGYEPLAGLK